MKTTVLIMAGGRGERFWPKSRKNIPKQFLPLMNPEKTMIRETVERILPLVKNEDIFIATSRDYRNMVREQIPELPEENILCEPVARNTAPCIGRAAMIIQKRYGEATMIVLPSDHLIGQPPLFRNAVKKAVKAAEKTNVLVTLGIAPTTPATGYGYIRYDASEEMDGTYRVREFVEKPDAATAAYYLANGEYLWNSGMFIWKTSVILKEIEKHLPEHYRLLQEMNEAKTPKETEATLQNAFEQMKPVSIDYGVMEKAGNVVVIPSSFGWDDVGSWLAVERVSPGNSEGNVIRGDAVTVNSSRCIVQGGERTIALVGLEDVIVVDTEDALLVCAKDSTEDIRKVLEELRKSGRTELL